MLSFVNGYLCTSSCDEAKAKRGVDPHPKLDPRQADGKADKTGKIMPASEVEDPAVVFGGVLAGLSASGRGNAAAAQTANSAAPRAPASIVDLLV